ncbi:MAG: hypothetical protein JWL84_5978 [Rhodospirillales bacterium]|nr:hypothetical protein [Rhodospirillales bacterium]
MAHGFNEVPDWFSFENQGVGIAVAERQGQRDLLVLMVDHPAPQGNRGLYRLARNVDATGKVSDGWTNWIEVPDWFSHENQGADIAVADLANTGGRDLVVFMIDNPPQQNRGLFRIGRGLDAAGAATGGWTGWIDVPDWFSWENQGGGIAVTPRDAQGRRHLVVFMIDNPPGLNRGFYRVGRDLDRDGIVHGGWSNWGEVPGWFSWENQGGGVAVADLAHDGTLDLIVFQIDNAMATPTATGQNQAFFRIGKGLTTDGAVAEWGQDWLGVPHWFSWENQHGAIATGAFQGTDKLVVAAVDNPPGQNVGIYTTMDLALDPTIYGKWEVLPFLSGVLAVHAALLPHGKVLFFAGSGSSRTRFDAADFGNVAKGVPVSVVWTPEGNDFFHPDTLRTAHGKVFDVFCGGDAFMPDGRMLSAGGTQGYGPFTGRTDAAIFDPTTQQWSFAGHMAHGRWYPSLITLGDGRILATTGLDAGGGDGSRKVMELYTPATNHWEAVHFADQFAGLPLYAHLFQMADGRVFFSGGRMDDPMQVDPCIFDLAHRRVQPQPVPDLLDPVRRNQSASVILPPAQKQTVMVCGGGPVGKADKTHATDRVSIVDLTQPHPAYRAAMPMALARMHLNLVLLPDHTVFASGGSLKQEDEPLSRLQAELYDPAKDEWRLMATATVARLYHSTALLLPDGRVVAAGGNPEGGSSVKFDPPDPEEEMRLEVFSPPYLFRGARPVIASVPAEWHYGQTVTIASASAGNIRWVTLIRNGVTTHSFDNGQRLIDLDIESQAAGTIRATVTGKPTIAPPGWYMLFLVDRQGVPSIATWIHLI